VRLVIHVGCHKTGSTAIQKALAGRSEVLLRQGCLYPRSGRGKHPGHPHLAWEAHGAPDLEPRAGGNVQLLAEIVDVQPSTVVLSSEEFTRVPSHVCARWARSLAGELATRDVSVIGYVRPQWEYIESLYAEFLKRGREWRPFGPFVDDQIRSMARLEYNALFDPWAEVGSLSIRPYRGDVVRDLWEVASLPGSAPQSDERPNSRFGLKTLTLCRELSSHLIAAGGEIPSGAFVKARDRFAEIVGDEPPFRAMTYSTAARVADAFRYSNAWFAAKYLDEPLPEPAPMPVPPQWSIAEANEDERRVFDEELRRMLDVMT
jgi:hypothetical protein